MRWGGASGCIDGCGAVGWVRGPFRSVGYPTPNLSPGALALVCLSTPPLPPLPALSPHPAKQSSISLMSAVVAAEACAPAPAPLPPSALSLPELPEPALGLAEPARFSSLAPTESWALSS